MAMLVGACGAGGSKPTTTSTAAAAAHPTGILNVRRVELAISQSIRVDRHLRAKVHCPKGVLQEKGLTFTCAATTYSHKHRVTTVFTVFQRNNVGGVYYQSPK